MNSLFVCPLCGGALTRREGSYLCPAGHCFDIAREGYTYLLPVNRKHSKTPGDDKAMAAARHAFLEKGYYAPLCEELCQLAVELTGDAPAVLDNGCGEGYYTAGIYRALCEAGKTPVMAGIDISKPILRLAAKQEKNVQFAVASSYRLPAADRSVDLLINCFSPLAIEEFRRVLRPGGHFIYVVPGEMRPPFLNSTHLTTPRQRMQGKLPCAVQFPLVFGKKSAIIKTTIFCGAITGTNRRRFLCP